MPKLGDYLSYPGTDSIVAAVARKYPNQVLYIRHLLYANGQCHQA